MYRAEGDLQDAISYYQKVTTDNSPEMAQYYSQAVRVISEVSGGNEYGAIAWSPVKQTVGSALAGSQAAAESGAMEDCKNRGGSTNCVVFSWFKHAWGVLATSTNGHVGVGWGWSTTSSAEARQFAIDAAVQSCTRVGGSNCSALESTALATAGVPGPSEGGPGTGWWYPSGEANWHYAVLGDSFSAGWGNPPYDRNSPHFHSTCGRSPDSYGQRLDDDVPTLGWLAFIACGGAVTDDFYNPNPKEPTQGVPQLLQLGLYAHVLSVTLTISGNDIGFENILARCSFYSPTTCQFDPDLNSRFNALAGTGSAQTPEGRRIWPLKDLLMDIYTKTKARIFVGGYPRLFGDKTSGYKSVKDSYGKLQYFCPLGEGLTMTYENAQWLNKQTDYVNKVLSEAVEAVRKPDVPITFVPVQEAYNGHGLCDTGESWIQEVRTDLRLQLPPIHALEGIHPTPEGQDAYMKTFRKAEGL